MKVLYLNITKRCNLSCWFCAAGIERGRGSDISTGQILHIFDRTRIGKGDYVTLNGGEATLHRGLPRVLDYLRNKRAHSALFTNGVLLADMRRAKKLAKSGLDHVCIPFYGSSAKRHDSMTKSRGSFQKTCRAVENLCLLKENGYPLTIELKVLHCRPLCRQGPSLAKYLARKFKNVDYISVNPPLYTGSAKIEIRRFAIDILATQRWINKTIDAIAGEGMRPSIPHLPYCVLAERNRQRKWRVGFLPFPFRKQIIYFDPVLQQGVIQQPQFCMQKRCKHCRFVRICPGFNPVDLGVVSSNKPALCMRHGD